MMASPLASPRPTRLVWGLLQRGIALLCAFHLVGVAPDLTALIGAKGLEPAADVMASLRHVAGLSAVQCHLRGKPQKLHTAVQLTVKRAREKGKTEEGRQEEDIEDVLKFLLIYYLLSMGCDRTT